MQKDAPRPFFQPGEASDPIYISHRDHGTKAPLKALIEEMWANFAPFCPDNHDDFLTDARSHFVQRVWEMYLANVLMRQFDLQKPLAEGPDILFEHEGVRCWVEAIAPGPGTEPNAVPQRDPQARWIPHIPEEMLILRLTSALNEKLSKIEKYRSKGIVGDGDACIIAINVSQILDADLEDHDVPMIIKALFPIGEAVIRFMTYSDKEPEFGYDHRDAVVKRRIGSNGVEDGASVPTTLFLDPRSGPISGVFYSSAGIWFGMNPLGRDINIVHNPQATVPITRDLFKFGRETFWLEGDKIQRDRRVYPNCPPL